MIRRWFSKMGVWGWLIAAVAGIVLLSAVSMAFLLTWHRWQIGVELERLRAAGEPVTLADLERGYPPPPPEHDATSHWLAGFAADRLAPSDPAYLQLPFSW